jgi:cysteine desulfurase
MFSLFSKKSKRIYLDNAGATPISKAAEVELIRTLSLYGNPSAIHREGDEASRVLHQARTTIARVLNAHSYEISFLSSGTESCNLAVMGTYEGYMKVEGRSQKSEGALPHIITSVIEHPSVLEPIRDLEKKGKVRVTYLPVHEDGIVKVKDVREALTQETILVSVMYANNEIGTIQPVKEIGRALEEWKRTEGRAFNAYPYFHIDACQAANYLNLDVVRLKTHLMTVNSSKVYGPKGAAILYKREGCRVEPITLGGGQERGLRSGTESVAAASAFSVALKEAVDMRERESMRLQAIRDYFFEEIVKEVPDVTIYGARGTGHEELRLPNNINIRVPGIPSDEMILRLDTRGFAVSHKSACASSETDGSYVIEALGATEQEALENIRITLGRDTSREDMEKLVAAIKEIKLQFGILTK